jgi:hypothetical protein
MCATEGNINNGLSASITRATVHCVIAAAILRGIGGAQHIVSEIRMRSA